MFRAGVCGLASPQNKNHQIEPWQGYVIIYTFLYDFEPFLMCLEDVHKACLA